MLPVAREQDDYFSAKIGNRPRSLTFPFGIFFIPRSRAPQMSRSLSRSVGAPTDRPTDRPTDLRSESSFTELERGLTFLPPPLPGIVSDFARVASSPSLSVHIWQTGHHDDDDVDVNDDDAGAALMEERGGDSGRPKRQRKRIKKRTHWEFSASIATKKETHPRISFRPLQSVGLETTKWP